jgi:hypothetical protein
MDFHSSLETRNNFRSLQDCGLQECKNFRDVMPDVFNARETAIGANLTDFFADVIF